MPEPRDPLETRLRAAFKAPETLPDAEGTWARISAATRQSPPRAARAVPRWFAVAAGIAAIVLGAAGGSVLRYAAPSRWEVVPIGSAAPTRTLGADEWLETSDAERLRLVVGRIGTADVGPGSRLRLERGRWQEHQLRLERGRLDVVIEAPPRLFFVRTPHALATDLGCAYEIEVGEDGGTRLYVTAGWVELAEGGRRSLVPAGLQADVSRDGIPGSPYDPSLASTARAALARIDAGRGSDADVDLVLAAMPSDAAAVVTRQLAGITLWHALQRVEAGQRGALVAALWRLAPPPTGVTREGIVALDRRMLDDWRRGLNPMWGEEAVPAWTALGRRLWLWAMD